MKLKAELNEWAKRWGAPNGDAPLAQLEAIVKEAVSDAEKRYEIQGKSFEDGAAAWKKNAVKLATRAEDAEEQYDKMTRRAGELQAELSEVESDASRYRDALKKIEDGGPAVFIASKALSAKKGTEHHPTCNHYQNPNPLAMCTCKDTDFRVESQGKGKEN